jgi:hypothetical protein
MRGTRIEEEADIYFNSTHVRVLSQFKLHISLLCPAELAWTQVIK